MGPLNIYTSLYLVILGPLYAWAVIQDTQLSVGSEKLESEPVVTNIPMQFSLKRTLLSQVFS